MPFYLLFKYLNNEFIYLFKYSTFLCSISQTIKFVGNYALFVKEVYFIYKNSVPKMGTLPQKRSGDRMSAAFFRPLLSIVCMGAVFS